MEISESSDGFTPQAQPPHAAPRRQLPEDPVAVVERLIADQASELTNEQRWDTYNEIDDHLSAQQAKLTLSERLAASRGREIQVWLESEFEGGQANGQLLDTGEGWCRLAHRSGSIVINVDAVVQWVNLAAGQVSEQKVTNQSWSSIIRSLSSQARPYTIWTRSGRILSGTLQAACHDHLEITGKIAIPYRQIAVLR